MALDLAAGDRRMTKNNSCYGRLVVDSPVPEVEGCEKASFSSRPQEMHLNINHSGQFF